MTDPKHDKSLLARLAIEALNAKFAWLIDHRDGDGVADLFTEGGVYDLGGEQVFSGRKEIAHFYAARRARGLRTARHVFTNLHVVLESDDRAHCVSILTLYAHDGAPPFPASALLVADYEDVCLLSDDERWLYRSRTIVPAFGLVPQLASRVVDKRPIESWLTLLSAALSKADTQPRPQDTARRGDPDVP